MRSGMGSFDVLFVVSLDNPLNIAFNVIYVVGNIVAEDCGVFKRINFLTGDERNSFLSLDFLFFI